MFGPFEVWHEGVQIEPGDLQQRYVLVILLLNANRAVSREYLQEYVWRGQRPKSDLITSYIARLRKVFKDAGVDDVVIDKSPTGYVLRVDEGSIDTVRFGRLHERSRHAKPTDAVPLLHEALDLWRGPFLSDLDIDRVGGPTMAPSEDTRGDALIDLAALELQAGNHRRIRDRLRPVWEEDRSQQRLAAMLMRALIANGDQVRAVEVFHQTRDALEEFGMETARELRDMAWMAQYGERLSSLPLRLARFTGRRDELALVDAAARATLEEGPAVLWISGMPGVGKTALAVHAAHRLAEAFPDGQLFVELNGFTPNVEPTAPATALERLLSDLGVPPEAIPESTRARSELYRSRLEDTRTLVVLDNAASEEQVEPLLPGVAGCLAVVTSRELGDLAATDHVHLEPLPAEEAVELFRKLVSADRTRGRVDQVREVVARCGQVPLLIHLVAAQFRRHLRWPLDHLVDLLREASPLSPDTSFSDLATVACTVSYQQLTDPQQDLFRLFGLVPGADLSAHGAAALVGAPVPKARLLLEDLHGVSLLEEPAPGRFLMLDPLRDYAVSAHPVDDPIAPVARLLDFYLTSTAAAMAVLFPFDRDRQPEIDQECPVVPRFADSAAAQTWLGDERRNLVAAINYAADHVYRDHTWKLAVLLWRYFYTAGHLRDWTETLQRAREVLRSSTNTRGLANVLLRLSGARRRSGAQSEARLLAEEALPLWEELGDVRGEAGTLTAIASAAQNLGDLPEAARCYAAALERFERIGDERGRANTLDHFGLVSELFGDFETAERQHRQAVELLRELGHTHGLAQSLDNLGCARQRLGRLDDALANHTEAREHAVSIGDRAAEAYALNNIGNTHRLAGRLEEATRFQQQARRVADLVVDPNLRTQLYLDRGETAWAGKDDRAALHAYRAALDMAAGTGESAQAARANHRIGTVLHETGHHNPAVPHWRDALAGYTELGLPEADQVRDQLSELSCACASSARSAPA
ncbi:MAG: tetratricopeptide repeat protein [Actinophytocola sp.]|uniref:AfsR/SARP family transcriptional regulator n=1 Tax=Actinophytocola sp. TaxID=1872138 RepID=UPI0013275AC7|nr:tetratricopeptide repeat protein [Actinophytocola sp.]MPZ80021.1 tetratricopeptide repeat protein [Actinophytocola sp.]